jgi:hypothetical protein
MMIMYRGTNAVPFPFGGVRLGRGRAIMLMEIRAMPSTTAATAMLAAVYY